MSNRTRLGIGVAALLVALSASQLHAQQPHRGSKGSRVPVTLVLVDSMPANEEFRIVRRPGENPHDLIILTPTADAGPLSAAVHDLLIIRSEQGDTAARNGLTRVRRPRH